MYFRRKCVFMYFNGSNLNAQLLNGELLSMAHVANKNVFKGYIMI